MTMGSAWSARRFARTCCADDPCSFDVLALPIGRDGLAVIGHRATARLVLAPPPTPA
jgi:hypothetical protein